MIVASERRPVAASEQWLSSVPELLETVCNAWGLSVGNQAMSGGAFGIVVCCRTEDGHEAVLKLCADHKRLRTEASALLAWASGPAVQVLAYRPGALLLQRARPGTPSRLAPSELALLLDSLHRPANAGEVGLGDWRASVTAAITRLPSLRALGCQLLREGDERPLYTLHGDLQPANIVQHYGASAVIDPVGIAGPRELDVANAALHNNWGEECSARIARLAALTGTDPTFALHFGQLTATYAALAPRY
jgi:streptomycin 6-kinase